MMRPYRLRKLFAPTAGFARAILAFLLGAIAFILGIGLSFRGFIRPILDWLEAVLREGTSAFVPADRVAITMHVLGGILLILGSYATFTGVRGAMSHIVETLNPGLRAGKMDIYRRRLQLAQGPRIVALGGGTGLSTILRGLKHHTSNITAIVTVTDDGGSSGQLIRDKGIIPPGDLRNCLVALADAEKSMTDLFQHRFKEDSGTLSGHAIGNLLITALADQAKGDFEKAVELASTVLNIRGQVLPATLDHVTLCAELTDGETVEGETTVSRFGGRIKWLFLKPRDCKPHPKALEAIRAADLICIGPGSVFTSVIPNLLVPGMAEAIRDSRAKKIYICNVMTQRGESETFTASQHTTAVADCVPDGVFDYVLVNTAIPSKASLDRYLGSEQHLVEADLDRLRKLGFKIVPGDYMSETDVVRHDPMKVAARLIKLIQS
jgi:uncharacterized cofD-like protein